MLALLGLTLLASPAARDALADRLGLRGVSIVHVPEATPLAVPAGATLGLGPPVSLDDARRLLGTDLLFPTELAVPDEVYGATGQVWLIYRARGVLMTELRASIDAEVLLNKSIPPGTHIEEVQVNGNRGYWIAGAVHILARESGGNFRDSPPRLAGNTLVWEQSGVTVRIEAAFDRDAAQRIAASVR